MAESETQQQIQADLKTAMKAREMDRVQALRLIISTLKNKRIELGRDLSEDDLVGVLSSEAKRRREAADAFRDGGRDELAAKEEAELAIITSYLPEQLGEDEVAELVRGIIAEVGAESPRDMGKVMGRLMPQIKGRFDGGAARAIVTAQLSV